MRDPLTGLIASVVFLVVLVTLFRYERKRGRRFAEYVRERADFAVLKIAHAIRMFVGVLGGGVVRQTLHYLFHAALSAVLGLLTLFQNGVREIMRSNRALARRSLKERTTRNKLDEIALHKIQVALSEEEKRRHKDRHLNG